MFKIKKKYVFLVQMSVLFKLRQSAEIQSMMAGINRLQITSCLYAEEHRETSKALVGFRFWRSLYNFKFKVEYIFKVILKGKKIPKWLIETL